MTSTVSICNMALSHIGVSPIASLTENTKQSRECKLLYDPAVESALRDHMWSFATKQFTLASYSTTYEGWEYAYQYPTDCIAARSMFDASGQTSVLDFAVMVDEDLAYKVIVTDIGNAVLEYTARVTNENLFDPLFVRALSWLLASDLAAPLRASPELQKVCFNTYQYTLGYAKSADGNEAARDPEDDANPYASSRA